MLPRVSLRLSLQRLHRTSCTGWRARYLQNNLQLNSTLMWALIKRFSRPACGFSSSTSSSSPPPPPSSSSSLFLDLDQYSFAEDFEKEYADEGSAQENDNVTRKSENNRIRICHFVTYEQCLEIRKHPKHRIWSSASFTISVAPINMKNPPLRDFVEGWEPNLSDVSLVGLKNANGQEPKRKKKGHNRGVVLSRKEKEKMYRQEKQFKQKVRYQRKYLRWKEDLDKNNPRFQVDEKSIRFRIITSKARVGETAVMRLHTHRRIRHAFIPFAKEHVVPGFDIVIMAKAAAYLMSSRDMSYELASALVKLGICRQDHPVPCITELNQHLEGPTYQQTRSKTKIKHKRLQSEIEAEAATPISNLVSDMSHLESVVVAGTHGMTTTATSTSTSSTNYRTNHETSNDTTTAATTTAPASRAVSQSISYAYFPPQLAGQCFPSKLAPSLAQALYSHAHQGNQLPALRAELEELFELSLRDPFFLELLMLPQEAHRSAGNNRRRIRKYMFGKHRFSEPVIKLLKLLVQTDNLEIFHDVIFYFRKSVSIEQSVAQFIQGRKRR